MNKDTVFGGVKAQAARAGEQRKGVRGTKRLQPLSSVTLFRFQAR